jgi:uncharacterized cupredoxin-like copper-binding protein
MKPILELPVRRLLIGPLVAAVVVLSACSGGASTTANSHTITLSDFKIATDTTNFAPGSYTFTIKNDGPSQHELLVFSSNLQPAAFPTDASGDMQEDGAGVTKVSDGDNIDPGKTQSRTVDLSQPGTYTLVCNLPGHFKAGMYTTITVTQ